MHDYTTTLNSRRPIMQKLLRRIAMTFALMLPITSMADTWSFEAKEARTVETFGSTKIVKIVDGRTDQRSPDFVVEVWNGDELKARYRGVSYDKLFASPDKSVFVGLSNTGLPGTAVVIFDKNGNLRLEAKHGMAIFDYCSVSATLLRQWFDDENPQVDFIPADKINDVFEMVRVKSCKGEMIGVISSTQQAYRRSFEQLEQLREPKKSSK